MMLVQGLGMTLRLWAKAGEAYGNHDISWYGESIDVKPPALLKKGSTPTCPYVELVSKTQLLSNVLEQLGWFMKHHM